MVVRNTSFTPISFFKKQKFAYWNANARLNLWEGSVRAGKTVDSIAVWIKKIANAPPGDLIMTGKTNGTLYRNIIRPMQEFLGSDMKYHQQDDSRVVSLWGRTIFCFGANDERAEQKIRGMTCAGSYGDEVSLWPESYFKMMISRMSVKGAQFFGTTNPDNPNHWLKTDFINRRNELNMNVFHFMIDDNTFLPPEFIAALKKEYVGLWYRRFILGEWCIAEGAIYDFFDENIHMLNIVPNARYKVLACDYGTGNPSAFLLFGINPFGTPKIWLEKTYYWDSKKEGRQKTDAEYTTDLKTFLHNEKVRHIIVDPSAASFKNQLRADGFSGIKNADNSVLDGIRLQAKMMQSHQYMICNHPSNAPIVNEYYGYVWDSKAMKHGEDKPLKENDHGKDGERYAIQTLFGGSQLDYTILNRM
jgi:PBSX family phage terminase large subunit